MLRASGLKYFDKDLALDHGICGFIAKDRSTALKVLAGFSGLLSPGKGNVEVCKTPSAERSRKFFSSLAYVPFVPDFPDVKPEEYARICGNFYPDFDMKLFNFALSAMSYPKNTLLSRAFSGDKRKAGFAFALAAKTPVLLLSDPFSGLEPKAVEAAKALVKEYRSSSNQLTVIYSQDHAHLNEICDLGIFLTNEKLVFSGKLSKLTDKLSLIPVSSPDPNALVNLAFKEKWLAVYPAEECHFTNIIIEHLAVLIFSSEFSDLARDYCI